MLAGWLAVFFVVEVAKMPALMEAEVSRVDG